MKYIGELCSLNVAFSRDLKMKKQYVQDLMIEENTAKMIAKVVLEDQGCVYICGDGTRMAKDVVKALEGIFDQYGDRAKDGSGNQVVQKMKEKKRLLLDIWGVGTT